ncbi:MAG TPA: T9SS type A sorting domain-containing protein [Puia sp.]|nr:T9SS type A sorting domain-containing protein [Puia sp.]
MKKNLLIGLFFFLALFNHAHAQQDHFVYAITSLQKSGTDWVCLRKLNTETNQFTTVMMNNEKIGADIYDTYSLKKILSFANDTFSNSNPQLAFGSGVAALAFDKKNNRIFYAPVLINELRYIDLNSMKTYTVADQSFSKAGKFDFYPAAISRMVIAPDGYGYTVTNDGNHLLRFNTNGNIVINDLGELFDAPTNTESVRNNPCSNSGGDMVADDNGSLYLISASNRVFKIDIQSRKTQFLGSISGLPQTFTANGAAVDENGNLIISSSAYSDSYFSVDPKKWAASPYKSMSETFTTADLANSNVLHTLPPSLFKTFANNSDKIKAYPNPIFSDKFNVQFNNLKTGNYTIQLTDAVGNIVLNNKIKVSQLLQTESLNVPGGNAQGFYFLRVLDEGNVSVFTQIIVIER